MPNAAPAPEIDERRSREALLSGIGKLDSLLKTLDMATRMRSTVQAVEAASWVGRSPAVVGDDASKKPICVSFLS
jgi:hypothetical protein